MKKVLTVLLVIAVMFTFSFSASFAATDEVKTYLNDNQAKYYEQLEKAANAVTFTYDEDGYLTKVDNVAVTTTGIFTKASVEKALEIALNKATVQLNATFGKLNTEATSVENAQERLDNAFNAIKANFFSASAMFEGEDGLGLLKDQIKTEKNAAYAVFAEYKVSDYSANSDDWSKDVASGKYFDDSNKYDTVAVTGLTAGKYPARTIVKNLLEKQNDVVTNADKDASTNAAYATAIVNVRTAVDTVKDILNGHKIGDAPANYYVEAIPTIDGLKNDTTLADAKANAIAVVTAKLSTAQVNIADALQTEIDQLNKKAKLTKEETKKLNKIKSLKASLAEDFANIKEVYVAKINYAETKTDANALKAELGGYADAFRGTVDATTGEYTDNGLKGAIEGTAQKVKWVKDLKADAEVLKSLKNVNGVAYYDAEQLNDNLEKAIEKVYKGKYATYQQAYNELTQGNDVALVEAKVLYTKIVNGDATNVNGVKDNDGNAVTKVWNKATAKRNVGVNAETVGEMKNISNAEYEVNAANKVVAMYDKAQKAELETLVKETKDAIKAAKSVSEVEKIFKDAHDKYVDIATTKDHYDSWNTGKLQNAFAKAGYEKELQEYAKYFAGKASSDYGTLNADTILSDVAYPIVYKAYTVDELADKVAEAKAAIDAIKTKDELKDDRDAVEAAIKALPTAKAITTADKDAIVAAADALDDYEDTLGSNQYPVRNKTALNAAKEAYEKLAAEAIEDAYEALDAKNITLADEDAIEALRDAFDAHDDFCKDYSVNPTLSATVDDDAIGDLEDALSAAKVKNVRDLMSKLPANPTEKDRAQVEAARAAYDALTVAEQLQLVGFAPYNAMIDAEEALGLNVGTAVKELKITAKSTAKKGSITVKWTVKGDASNIDGYEIWKSTKQSKGYKKAFTTTKQTYKNTKNLKKGTRYYFKVRAYKMVDGVKLTSDWSNKAYRVAK